MDTLDNTTVLEIVAVLVGMMLVVQMAVLWFVLRIRRKTMSPDELLRESRQKTESTIQRAIRDANKILVSAQLKGIQLLSQEKVDRNDLAQEFETHLKTIEKALEDQLGKNATFAADSYTDFIKTTEKTIQDHIVDNQKMLEEKSRLMAEKTEGLLTKLSQDVEATIRKELDGELEKAKSEITVYRQERIRVIDERIVDVLEAVIRIALAKKMDLADQSDLIYKALEQAKKENAFGTPTPDYG